MVVCSILFVLSLFCFASISQFGVSALLIVFLQAHSTLLWSFITCPLCIIFYMSFKNLTLREISMQPY